MMLGRAFAGRSQSLETRAFDSMAEIARIIGARADARQENLLSEYESLVREHPPLQRQRIMTRLRLHQTRLQSFTGLFEKYAAMNPYENYIYQTLQHVRVLDFESVDTEILNRPQYRFLKSFFDAGNDDDGLYFDEENVISIYQNDDDFVTLCHEVSHLLVNAMTYAEDRTIPLPHLFDALEEFMPENFAHVDDVSRCESSIGGHTQAFYTIHNLFYAKVMSLFRGSEGPRFFETLTAENASLQAKNRVFEMIDIPRVQQLTRKRGFHDTPMADLYTQYKTSFLLRDAPSRGEAIPLEAVETEFRREAGGAASV